MAHYHRARGDRRNRRWSISSMQRFLGRLAGNVIARLIVEAITNLLS